MSYQNAFLKRLSTKYGAKSYMKRYIGFYWFFKAVIVTALLYSAFASFNYYQATFQSLPYPAVISGIVTVAISVFIFYATSHVMELWHSEYSFDFVALILGVLVAWNAYTDWVGVHDTSIKAIDKPHDTQTERLDGLYAQTIGGFDAAIAKENKAIEKNMDWNKGKANWGKYNKWKSATERYTEIQREKEDFISSWTDQRAQSVANHNQNLITYQSKVDRLTGSLRGAVAVCLVSVLALSFWCSSFEKKCLTSCVTDRTESNEQTNSDQISWKVSKKNIRDEYPLTYALLLEGKSIRKAKKEANEGCSHHAAYKMYKEIHVKKQA